MDGQCCERTKRCLRAIDKASEDLCEKFRQRCLHALQPAELEKCGIEKSSLEKCVNSLTDQLLTHMNAESKAIVDDLNLDEKFKTLSQLIEEQEEYKGTPAWRPSGNPDEDIQDHLRQLYAKYVKDMTSALKESKEKTNVLEAQVAEGNKELQRIGAEIDITLAKLEKLQLANRRRKTDAHEGWHDTS
ncbi:uncharacterized protein LOC119188306 [Rhipicephalus microplus]|uniref:uncharacterized protein LOC119188306 n=1 Tax=Rhipicephalus microplus TaxID=6941 RepID=UPI003F6C0F7C